MTFTPGPWEVIKHERFPFEREVKSEDGYICDMEGLSDSDMPTVEANARLIAAAPEMYEALKRLVSDFECDYVLDGVVVDDPPTVWVSGYNIARAALAKAVQP